MKFFKRQTESLDRAKLKELISNALDRLNDTYTEDNVYTLLYFFTENYIDVIKEKYPDADRKAIKLGLTQEVEKL